MTDLREALVGTGLGKAEDAEKIEKTKKTRLGQNISRTNKKVSSNASLDRLNTATTVSQFKQEAKILLLEDPDLISQVIEGAQRLKSEDGGRKLLWLLYSTRDNLEKVKPKFQEQVIKRALRSSKPTTRLKPEWK